MKSWGLNKPRQLALKKRWGRRSYTCNSANGFIGMGKEGGFLDWHKDPDNDKISLKHGLTLFSEWVLPSTLALTLHFN